ncbi:hypothetical protein NBRC116601_15720 [Cognatishimia sp. WU-CL00825]|uniref:hypothetical protein n=1 Tax=Cognatishimia sp. WU-CL00825 TaxID=3127658 RepID=UPI003103B92D
MTVLQEIALRQSLTYAGFVTAAVLALLYAGLLSYRPTSIHRSVAVVLPTMGLLVAAFANFAAPLILIALGIAVLTDAALSRRSKPGWQSASIGILVLQALYFIHFLTRSSFQDLHVLPAGVVIGVALLLDINLRKLGCDLKDPLRVQGALAAGVLLAALCLPNNPLAILGAGALLLSVQLRAVIQLRLTSPNRALIPTAMALWFLTFVANAAILAGAGFAQPLFSI